MGHVWDYQMITHLPLGLSVDFTLYGLSGLFLGVIKPTGYLPGFQQPHECLQPKATCSIFHNYSNMPWTCDSNTGAECFGYCNVIIKHGNQQSFPKAELGSAIDAGDCVTGPPPLHPSTILVHGIGLCQPVQSLGFVSWSWKSPSQPHQGSSNSKGFWFAQEVIKRSCF